VVEKNSNGLSALRKNISDVFELLGNPVIDELDEKLSSVPAERYNEEIDKLISNVPLEKRGLVKRFLDTRRSFVLMKRESEGKKKG
jgi:hypothetical protein